MKIDGQGSIFMIFVEQNLKTPATFYEVVEKFK